MKNKIDIMAPTMAHANLHLSPDSQEGIGTENVYPANVGENENENNENENEKASTNFIGEKDGIKYVRNEYRGGRGKEDSPLKGWGFAVPRFESAQQIINHYDKLCKEQGKTDINGEKILLDLFHTALEAKARIRVKAGVPEFKKEEQAIEFFENEAKKSPDKLLFGIEEASTWLPGVRELSLKKQIEQGMEDVQELIKQYGAASPQVMEAMLKLAQKMASK